MHICVIDIHIYRIRIIYIHTYIYIYIHRVDCMTIGVLWEYPVEVIFISSMSSPSQLAFSFRVMLLSGLETTGWKGTTVTAGVPQIYSCWSWVNGVPHVGWVFQCRFCQCQEGHNCNRLHTWFVFFCFAILTMVNIQGPRYYEKNMRQLFGIHFPWSGCFFVVKCLGSQNELLSLGAFSGGFQGRLHKDIKVIESKLRGQ